MKKREEKLGIGEKRRENHKDRIDLSEKKRKTRRKKKSRVESSGMDCGREEKRREEEVKFCVEEREREREREREATVSERSGGTVLHPRCRLLLGIGGTESGL